MCNEAPHRRDRDPWRISIVPGSPAAIVAPTAGPGLQRVPSGEAWDATGGSAFAIDADALGRPLPAGWYVLRGRIDVRGGSATLPSVRVHYVRHSALTEVELVLPDPDETGRVAVLLLLFEDARALEFVPSLTPARFAMRDFSLRRVPRTVALRMMLAVRRDGIIARILGWVRKCMACGLRRATDDLYAEYCSLVRAPDADEYQTWIRKYDTLGPDAPDEFQGRARALGERGPLVSLLLGVDGATETALRRCLDCVLRQAWPHWELCLPGVPSHAPRLAAVLAEYAARDPRIRIIRDDGIRARDGLLAGARGGFIALLEADGELRPHALLRIAETAAADREAAIIYSDEDGIDADGKRVDHHFKPDWDPDLLLGRNYVGGLVAIRAALAREAGGFRAGFEGDRGYDLLLRCSERIAAAQVRHVRAILHHRHAPWAPGSAAPDGGSRGDAGVRAVAEHLRRMGLDARVEAMEGSPGLRRIHWPLPQPAPKVSLIIPTRDRAKLLRTCVESILSRTEYPDFELVVVDNQSSERAALAYLRELESRDRVRVLRDDAPFNFSAINNRAARQCSGGVLGLVNNDIEVISPGWLAEMVGLAMRPQTGAVGAMLRYPDDTVQHAGMVLGLFGVAGHVYAGKPCGLRGYHGRARVAQNLSVVTGACLVVRREVFEAVGGLDESLPVEFNDVDFCLRILQRGYRNAWTPFAELYHHESASRRVAGAAARRARSAEVAIMLDRWGRMLGEDPAYNPNLTLQGRDFQLAFPPRQPQREP